MTYFIKNDILPQGMELAEQGEFADANSTFWERVFMELPDGIMWIIIQATRPEQRSLSAIAIDDITIWPCTDFCKNPLYCYRQSVISLKTCFVPIQCCSPILSVVNHKTVKDYLRI